MLLRSIKCSYYSDYLTRDGYYPVQDLYIIVAKSCTCELWVGLVPMATVPDMMRTNAHVGDGVTALGPAVMSVGYLVPSALFYMKNDTCLIILTCTSLEVFIFSQLLIILPIVYQKITNQHSSVFKQTTMSGH